MKNLVNLVILIEPSVKKDFYNLCRSINTSPMRTILILMERFSTGKIDALPVLEDYKVWKATERDAKTKRLLKYRVDGSYSRKKKSIINLTKK